MYNDLIIDVLFDETKITLKCENKYIYLLAIAECCSQSYFLPESYDDYRQLIGKTICNIDEICDDGSELDINNTSNNSVINVHYHCMTFNDDSIFKFSLVNISNGYYDGWLSIKIKSIENIENNENNKDKNATELIIVIGLPGSGKTKYCNMIIKENKNMYDKIINYDDILTNYQKKFFDDINDKSKKLVIVNDPRFCNKENFISFIEETTKYIYDENIKLILFENNIENCINNVKKRNYKIDAYCNSIIEYSKLYNINDNNYTQYYHEIIKVIDYSKK